PETLEEYIRHDGLTHFKIKVSGDTEEAMERLQRIWSVIVSEKVSTPYVTLDCNEAYGDLDALEKFVVTLGAGLPELFHHIALIEQPLPRSMVVDADASAVLRRIAARKQLMIDEGDGTVEAFREAQGLGFSGVSHKNCKGVFKSLMNRMLCDQWNAAGVATIMSAEDLTHMPIVSLHQDFATVAALGLDNAERNAHHYFYGLSHLSGNEKASVANDYPSLYTERRGEWFMDIRSGVVDCGPILDAVGFGVRREPDWSMMTPMAAWNRNLAENS
ncbi:MAG: mandelate racemase, partial [Verrucomicrobia bacterium]|nr:mandelate racemase [Verrucomicrobiota bacterium]